MSEIEQPVTTSDGRDGTRTTHPAFSQITVHRSQGSGRSLYGSDFMHNATLSICIHASECGRSLNHDWHYAKEQYIEVELSEAQWATFVSSVGVGSGVPCTLRQRIGQRVPDLSDPTPRTEQFSGELSERLDNILKRCDDLIAGAKTKAQQSELRMLKQELKSNLPYVARSFDSHMEKTVEAAKSEVHGYMTGAIQRAGLDALGATPPLQLLAPPQSL